jgi:hypothetical protein
MDADKKVVLLKKVLDEIEAIRIRDFLAGAGIECQVISFHDRALDGISQIWSEGHWGEIRVFEEDVEKARQILSDLESEPQDTEGG